MYIPPPVVVPPVPALTVIVCLATANIAIYEALVVTVIDREALVLLSLHLVNTYPVFGVALIVMIVPVEYVPPPLTVP